MIISRKRFLQLTGGGALAVAAAKSGGTFAGAVQESAVASQAALSASRWAMVVDVSKCLEAEGCTKCVEACNQAHNVPDFSDHAHQIQWIWKAPFESAFSSQENEYLEETLAKAPVPLLCNHCDSPPCVRVCPTQATWKREDGIVMMDWHRCIGCRYCMAACPYGSRSFNWTDPRSEIAQLNPDFPTRTKGVVEKCDFCQERLAHGEIPACVEVCPEKAMVFGDLLDSSSEVRMLLRSRYSIRRKPELGTKPEIFYLV